MNSIYSAERYSVEVGPVTDNFPLHGLGWSALFEITKVVGLYFEQTSFHCRGAPQPPQQTG